MTRMPQQLPTIELTVAPGVNRTSIALGAVLRTVRFASGQRTASVFLSAMPDGPPLRPPLRVTARLADTGRVDPTAQWTVQRRDLRTAFPSGFGTCWLVVALGGAIVAVAPVRVALPD